MATTARSIVGVGVSVWLALLGACGNETENPTPGMDGSSSSGPSTDGTSTTAIPEGSSTGSALPSSTDTTATTGSTDCEAQGACVCGNGVVEGDEACDDGNDVDDDACATDCTTRCGDGELEPELCFDPPLTYEIAGLQPTVEVGHLDDDAHLDVAVIGDGAVQLLRGMGDGTLLADLALAVPDEDVSALTLGDVDADGRLDVVTGLQPGGGLATFRGDDAGAFESPDLTPTLRDEQSPQNLALADLDGDGTLDLVTRTAGGGVFAGSPRLHLVSGNGDGTFTPVDSSSAFMLGPPAAADLDADGFTDVALAAPPLNEQSGELWIYWGDGTLTLSTPEIVSFGWTPSDTWPADVDGDGVLDLLTNDVGIGRIHYIRGTEGGTFDPPVELDAGPFPAGAAVGDIDHDGTPDVVVANSATPGRITILRNIGSPDAPAPWTVELADYVQGIALADLDQDGALDLIASSPGTDTLTVFRFDP